MGKNYKTITFTFFIFILLSLFTLNFSKKLVNEKIFVRKEKEVKDL